MSGFLHNTINTITHAQHVAVHSPTTHGSHVEQVGKHSVIVRRRLAEGAYGLVDLVVDQISNKEYVLKRCSIQRPEVFELVNKEIKILQLFAGPFIVEYFGSEIVNTPGKGKEALILLAYCPGGNLFEKLSSRNGKYIPWSNCLKIFQQIVLSVQAFHEHNPPVTHRDLKLENLLFAADGSIRLCDFGSCCIGYTYLRNAAERAVAEEIVAKETTPMYRAPEMIDLYIRDVLTEKTDIWALGCIFATVCYLRHPFQDVGSLGILSCKLQFPTDALATADAKEIIGRMLDPDPEARPCVSDLLNWIDSLLSGNPLPVYQICAEAQQKRNERIQANIAREQKKNAKKIASVVPERKVATPGVASDSVAAKRLAAKRGSAHAVLTHVASNNSLNPVSAPSSITTPHRVNSTQHATNATPQTSQHTPVQSILFETAFEKFDSSSSLDFPKETASSIPNTQHFSQPVRLSNIAERHGSSHASIESADFLFDEVEQDLPVPLSTTAAKSAPIPTSKPVVTVSNAGSLSFETHQQFTDPFNMSISQSSFSTQPSTGFNDFAPLTDLAGPTNKSRSIPCAKVTNFDAFDLLEDTEAANNLRIAQRTPKSAPFQRYDAVDLGGNNSTGHSSVSSAEAIYNDRGFENFSPQKSSTNATGAIGGFDAFDIISHNSTTSTPQHQSQRQPEKASNTFDAFAIAEVSSSVTACDSAPTINITLPQTLTPPRQQLNSNPPTNSSHTNQISNLPAAHPKSEPKFGEIGFDSTFLDAFQISPRGSLASSPACDTSQNSQHNHQQQQPVTIYTHHISKMSAANATTASISTTRGLSSTASIDLMDMSEHSSTGPPAKPVKPWKLSQPLDLLSDEVNVTTPKNEKKITIESLLDPFRSNVTPIINNSPRNSNGPLRAQSFTLNNSTAGTTNSTFTTSIPLEHRTLRRSNSTSAARPVNLDDLSDLFPTSSSNHKSVANQPSSVINLSSSSSIFRLEPVGSIVNNSSWYKGKGPPPGGDPFGSLTPISPRK